MAGGTKYHAHFVPNDELTADFYEAACQRLNAAGVFQYETSNFARPGKESRHNLKYWTRQPYLGFGVDAHSMLSAPQTRAKVCVSRRRIRSRSTLPARPPKKYWFSATAALEETFFLGLRLTKGVDLKKVAADFGEPALRAFTEMISECVDLGLLEWEGGVIRLTGRGRLLSERGFRTIHSVWVGHFCPTRLMLFFWLVITGGRTLSL